MLRQCFHHAEQIKAEIEDSRIRIVEGRTLIAAADHPRGLSDSSQGNFLPVNYGLEGELEFKGNPTSSPFFLDFDLREGAGGEGGFEGVDGVLVEDLGADEVDEAAGGVGVAVGARPFEIEGAELGVVEVDAAIFFVVANAAGELRSCRRCCLASKVVQEVLSPVCWLSWSERSGGDVEAKENFVFVGEGFDGGLVEAQFSDAGVIAD